MICPTCNSSTFTMNESMIYICDYCLMPIENQRFDEFLVKFKTSYLNHENLSELLLEYQDQLTNVRFPYVIRDYVNSNYNRNIIVSSLNSLPEFELKKLKEIISSDGDYRYSFESSLEYFNHLLELQDEELDQLSELKFLLILVANEYGSTKYQGLEDLRLLSYEPKIEIIESKFNAYFKGFNASFRRNNDQIRKLIEKYRKAFYSYTMDTTLESVFTTREHLNTVYITKVNAKQPRIQIPPMIKGKIVRGIDQSAFLSLPAVHIEIPLTIVELPAYSIQDCQKLEYIKFYGATIFSALSFKNTPELTVVDVDLSNQYKSLEGVIFDIFETNLVYYPPALNKLSLTIPKNCKVLKYSCFEARYLREVVFESAQIEKDAFQLGQLSLLEPLSIVKLNEAIGQKAKTSQKEKIELTQISKESIELLVQNDHIDSVDELFAALLAFDEKEQVDLLESYFDKFKSENDSDRILSKLIETELGRKRILLLTNLLTKHKYYLAKSLYLEPKPDYETILQLFLESYGAGNSSAGINASIMLKKGQGMNQDLLYAERILVDLIKQDNLEAYLRLLTLYNQYPQLLESNHHDINLVEIIDKLDNRNPKGYSELKADMLFSGRLIERNIPMALEIYEDLFNLGNANAAYQLGYIYSMEDELIDYERSILYFQNAHNLGHPNALRQIEKIRALIIQEEDK